jgi:hypothetical protein
MQLSKVTSFGTLDDCFSFKQFKGRFRTDMPQGAADVGKYPLLDDFAQKRQCSEPLAKSHVYD